MLTIEQTGFGGVNMLEFGERADPVMDQPYAVRVALSSAGVSRWDLLRSRGLFGGGHPSFVAGYQGCGLVEAVGPLVNSLRPGDRVWWSAPDAASVNGAWAEFRVADASQLARVPDEVGTIAAAVAPLALVTAMLGMDEMLRHGRPRRVLVHDAASEVGYLLVQLATLATLRVAALVRDEEQQTALAHLGAEVAEIDDSLDGMAAIEDWSEGVGCDALLCCGEPARAVDAFGLLGTGGRAIVCAPGEPVGAWRASCERGLSLQVVNPLLATDEAREHRRRYLQEGGEMLAHGRLELPRIASAPLAQALEVLARMDAESESGPLVLVKQ